MELDDYRAPALEASDFFGIQIHNSWGLNDHAELQKRILYKGPVKNGYDIDLVEEIISDQKWTQGYKDFNRYHAALGMVSQYNQDDIEYFISTPYSQRKHSLKLREDRISLCTGFNFFWVLSNYTLLKLEKHLNLK